jgi:hypothetical protein
MRRRQFGVAFVALGMIRTMNQALWMRVALVVVLLACGCSSATVPTAPPSPAPRAALSIGLEGSGQAIGIAQYSAMLFDGGESTGDGLSYRLDFGDGTTSSAPKTTHVPVIPQTATTFHSLTASLTVTDRLGRSDTVAQTYHVARLQFPVFGFWVNWLQTGPEGYRADFRVLSFKVSGAQISGEYTGPEGKDRTFTGTLSGERDIHLRLDDGTIEMQGSIALSGSGAVLRLNVRGGIADGRVLEFRFDSIY